MSKNTKIILSIKKTTELDNYELKKINKLVLKTGTMMSNFNKCRLDNIGHCILAKKENTSNLVGWLLAYKPNGQTGSNRIINIYVDRHYRHNEIGHKLIHEAIKLWGRENLRCIRWSKISRSFFDKYKIENVN